MITPQQLRNPQVKPKWNVPVGVMESVVQYNCRIHGFPRPVVAMPMWEGAGNQAIDYSGYSNHGVLTNGASWIGEDIDFNGTDDHIELTDIDGSTPFPKITVSCRVSLDVKTDFDTIIDKNDSIFVNANTTFRMFLDNSADQKWRWKVWGADGVTAGNVDSDAVAQTGKFTHVLGSYDGSEVAMWVDDVKQAITQSETGNLFSASNIVRVGAGGVQRLDGKFKSLVIFKEALSAAQKTFLHNNPYFMFQAPEELYGYIAAIVGNSKWYFDMLKRRNS